MRMYSIIAWFVLLLSLASWGGYVYLLQTLSADRAAYATALEEKKQEELRQQSTTRIQAAVRDTEVERAALDALIKVPIVDAVDIIEAAGRAAGARSVSIGGATPAGSTAKELSPVSVIVNVEGTFPALMRALSLFERLPIPSVVEQFDVRSTENGWALSARVKLLIAE